MFRTTMIAIAILVSADQALANGGHGSSSSAPPPPPKQEGPPAQAVITKKNGPMLVDPKGMTLYYFERDNSGRYQLLLMATRLILRPEGAPTMIGATFDNR